MKLWYTKPANIFEEALPIGNGRVGAMVYGKVKKEKIALNEDTCWAGYPQDKSDVNVQKYLYEAREKIAEGKKTEAQEITWKHMMSTWTESYQPVGNLILEMSHSEEVTGYKRELDLEDAVANTTYVVEDVKYMRRVYASSPDQVIVVHLLANEKGKISFSAYLESPHPVEIMEKEVTQYKDSETYYVMTGKTPAYTAPSYYKDENPIRYELDGQCGLTFYAGIATKIMGGKRAIKDGVLLVEGADEVILYINIATNYSGRDIAPKDSTIDAGKLCLDQLQKVKEKSEQDIWNNHKKDYRALYNRVELRLYGEDQRNVPTDERIKNYTQSAHQDKDLPVLLFNYGRYLLIASSRLNTQPANLQGIWNESLRAPWSSNYTLNINAQMNYWLAEVTNLSECHMPLIEYTKDLKKKGERTAKNNYGARGWCAHHNSDIWAQTEPVGKLAAGSGCNAYAFWVQGGNWLVHHIWEHYEFTRDIDFLKAYSDVIYGAGYFLIDWAFERDGKVVMSPSISPENTYFEDGNHLAICENSAMDLAILKEVMMICIQVGELLDEEADLVKTCKEKVAKIPEFQVGNKGQLLEWDKEYEEAEPLHRHLSLLYGFYPAHVMNHKETPQLINPIRKTMELRGDVATGWGIAWKINVWARLRDGNHSKKVLDYVLNYVDSTVIDMGAGGGIYPNMLCAHPPFQIDGNFGAAAGIAEMLLQSHEEAVHLLPAIPDEWDKGSVRGLCARGGLEVAIEWEDGSLKKATLKASNHVKKDIIYKDKVWQIDLKAGESTLVIM